MRFDALPLDPAQLAVIERLGYAAMTPIQADALPTLLTGRDLIAQADTGTGKTAAFGLALLASVQPGQQRPQALILCPTRELATQIVEALRALGAWRPNLRVVELCGGKPARHQRDTLARGADIIVGTPGRVLDHLTQGHLQLDHIRHIVLDEADRMLDMGFFDDVTTICEATPRERQTILCSATMDERAHRISLRLQRDPALIRAASAPQPAIHLVSYAVEDDTRLDALLRVLAHHDPARALIFCEQRATCDQLARDLAWASIGASVIHGGMEQRDRDAALAKLAGDAVRWLIATDVAARGIDIPDLPAIIHYELPRDVEAATHRAGRTGRAGKQGLAISLLNAREATRAEALGIPAPQPLDSLPPVFEPPQPAPYALVALHAGKRDKLRPGDIVGALTGTLGFKAADLGVIQILENISYVAIRREVAQRAAAAISRGKIKARSVRATLLT